MSLHFDTIEDAIIDAIRNASDMSYLATCEHYAGQGFAEEDLRELSVNFPAVFVILAEMPVEKIDEINYNLQPLFRVLAAAENHMGRDDAKKAAYAIVKDVLAVITNNTFGLAIESLTLRSVQLVYIDNYRAVYGLEFQTDFDATYDYKEDLWQ